uniref:Replication-associated protein n=1 Tax=Switchgrass umbra-like virus 2 TaxID=3233124 RepID=A0AAU8MJ65_9TOMB
MAWQAIARIFARKGRSTPVTSVTVGLIECPLVGTGSGPAPPLSEVAVQLPQACDHGRPTARQRLEADWADWLYVVNDGRFYYAKSIQAEIAEDRVDGEIRSWMLGNTSSKSAQMALQLREHFGVRAPMEANHLMGERWLLDKHITDEEELTPLRGEQISLAVRLWTTPSVEDAAIGGRHFYSGW